MVAVAVSDRRVIALSRRIAPDRLPDPVRGLPLISGMHMSMQPGQRIAEDLVVDAPQTMSVARALYGLADQCEVKQKLGPACLVEIGQVVDRGILAEQQRIARVLS